MDLRSPSSTGVTAGAVGDTVDVAVRAGACSRPPSSMAGVRWMPPGPISKAQASITAITNPRATSRMTSVVVHSGSLSPGRTVEVT